MSWQRINISGSHRRRHINRRFTCTYQYDEFIENKRGGKRNVAVCNLTQRAPRPGPTVWPHWLHLWLWRRGIWQRRWFWSAGILIWLWIWLWILIYWRWRRRQRRQRRRRQRRWQQQQQQQRWKCSRRATKTTRTNQWQMTLYMSATEYKPLWTDKYDISVVNTLLPPLH